MNRVVRAFLIWVMVIAMPVQGMAASMMGSCGPSHARMMQGLGGVAPVARADQVGEPGHGHHHAAAAHAGHAHAGQGDSVASRLSADADGAHSPLPDHGMFSCSACAACCSVLAVPSSFAPPEVVSLLQAVRASPLAPAASHQPDGLERPPRAAFA